MKQSRIGYLLWFALCLLPDRAHCDDELPELTIHNQGGTYSEQVREQAGNVDSFTDRDIENFTTLTADEFLRQVPGFSLFRRSPSTTSHPTSQGVSLRGTGPSGASRTVVLVNGIPVNDPFGGWVNWGRIPLQSIEHVRVQENWGANHWSALGLGSVIEFTTAEPGWENNKITGGVGTHDTSFVNAAIGGKGDLSYTAIGDFYRTGGYNAVSPEDRGPIDIRTDSKHLLGNGAVSYSHTDNTKYYLSVDGFGEDRGNGTPLTNNESNIGTVSTGVVHRRADGSSVRAALFGTDAGFNSTFSSQAPDRSIETPSLDQFAVPSTQIGGQADWSKRFGDDVLELGMDLLRRRGVTKEYFRFVDGDFQRQRDAGATQIIGGFYGSYHYALGEKTSLDIFGRVDGRQNQSIFLRDRSRTDPNDDRFERSHDDFTVFVEPRLQLRYEPSENLSMRSTLTRSVRVPTINELVRPFRVRNDITAANEDLNEEKAIGYDFEATFQSGEQQVSVNPYINILADPIANVTLGNGPGTIDPCGVVPQGGVCRQRQNLERALVYGVEVRGQTSFPDGTVLSSSYLLSYSEVTNPGDAANLDGKNLPQLPKHQAAVRIEKTFDAVTAFFQTRFVGKQYDDDLNTLPLGSFTTFDASVTYDVGNGKELFLTGENLLDKRYSVAETSDNVTSTGQPLNILGGLRFSF